MTSTPTGYRTVDDPVDAEVDRVIGRSALLHFLLAPPPTWPLRARVRRWAVRRFTRRRGPLVRYWSAEFVYLGRDPVKVEPWARWARRVITGR